MDLQHYIIIEYWNTLKILHWSWEALLSWLCQQILTDHPVPYGKFWIPNQCISVWNVCQISNVFASRYFQMRSTSGTWCIEWQSTVQSQIDYRGPCYRPCSSRTRMWRVSYRTRSARYFLHLGRSRKVPETQKDVPHFFIVYKFLFYFKLHFSG